MTEAKANAWFRGRARLHQPPQVGRGSWFRLGVLLASLAFAFLVMSGSGPSDDAIWLFCLTLLVLAFAPASLLAIHEWRLQAGDRYADGELRVGHEGLAWTAQGEPTVRWDMSHIAAARLFVHASRAVVLLTPISASESLAWEVDGRHLRPDIVSLFESSGKASGSIVFRVRAPFRSTSDEMWVVLSPVGGMIAAIVAVGLDRIFLQSSVSYGLALWLPILLGVFLLLFAAASVTMVAWCSRPFDQLAIEGGRVRHSGQPARMIESSAHSSRSSNVLSLNVLAETGKEEGHLVQLVLFSMGPLQLEVVESCLRERKVGHGADEGRSPSQS